MEKLLDIRLLLEYTFFFFFLHLLYDFSPSHGAEVCSRHVLNKTAYRLTQSNVQSNIILHGNVCFTTLTTFV